MTKLEEVAEAMKAAREAKIERPLTECYDDMAKAALEAMREPTSGMLDYSGTISGYDEDRITADSDHKDWWNIMIDAAWVGK